MSTVAEELLDKVRRTVRRHAMLPERGSLLLAVSGGPDSLALLHLMKRLRDADYHALSLHAAHLHHGMRGEEAEEDCRFVASEAARLGVGFLTRRTDVPELARLRGIGVEQAGRDARYEFLLESARRLGAERVALGHQADDQAETVLMRARRGTGPRGAVGIPCVRRAGELFIVRPLLDCTRAEIEAFLADSGLRGRLDATNLSADYLRNRMRSRILPALKREWGESLQPQLCALADAAQRLRAQAERLCAPCRSIGRLSEAGVEADVRALLPLRDSLLPDLMRAWLEEAGIWSKTLTRKDYARLAQLLAPGLSEGAVDLPGGLTARRCRDTLTIQRAKKESIGGARSPHRAQEEFPATALAESGPTDLGCRGRMEAERIAGGLELLARRASPLEEYVDFDRLTGKLEVRAPRPGDRMRPLGAPGRRKLQDILTDLHIPPWRRKRLPVLTANGEPVWIVGVRIAEEVRLTQRTTRALHIRFIPPEPAR